MVLFLLARLAGDGAPALGRHRLLHRAGHAHLAAGASSPVAAGAPSPPCSAQRPGRLKALVRIAVGGIVPTALITVGAYVAIGKLQVFLDDFFLINAALHPAGLALSDTGAVIWSFMVDAYGWVAVGARRCGIGRHARCSASAWRAARPVVRRGGGAGRLRRRTSSCAALVVQGVQRLARRLLRAARRRSLGIGGLAALLGPSGCRPGSRWPRRRLGGGRHRRWRLPRAPSAPRRRRSTTQRADVDAVMAILPPGATHRSPSRRRSRWCSPTSATSRASSSSATASIDYVEATWPGGIARLRRWLVAPRSPTVIAVGHAVGTPAWLRARHGPGLRRVGARQRLGLVPAPRRGQPAPRAGLRIALDDRSDAWEDARHDLARRCDRPSTGAQFTLLDRDPGLQQRGHRRRRPSTGSSRSSTEAGLDHELILVNDGSRDGSWDVIAEKARTSPHVVALNLLQELRPAPRQPRRAARGHRRLRHHHGRRPAEPARPGAAADRRGDERQGRRLRPLRAQEGGRLPPDRQQADQHDQPPGLRPAHRTSTVSNFRILRRDVVDRICASRTAHPYITGQALHLLQQPRPT